MGSAFGFVDQRYLPDQLEGARFYAPTGRGYEEHVVRRLDYWNALRKKRARVPIYRMPPMIPNWVILRFPMKPACAKPRLVKSHHSTMLHI